VNLRLQALSISPGAKEWVNNTRQAAILSVFDQAWNLINTDGEVLSLVVRTIGNGPFSIVLDAESLANNLSPDTGISTENGKIIIGDIHIETQNAQLNNPSPHWKSFRANWEVIQRQNKIIEKILRKPEHNDSFAALLGGHNVTDSMQSRVLQKAKPLVEGLVGGIAEGNMDAICQSASQLAGLGSGLTPAGDDFLVGVMHGLWARDDERERICTLIADSAAPHTTALSRAWLIAAARGEAWEGWHNLLDALISENQVKINAAMNTVLAMGHTSGADALTGFVTTINM
jgi:hypothetical protein